MFWGNPSTGLLDNTHRQGAGMLRIDKAVLNTTRVSPGKLSLGDTQAGPVTQTLTISNEGMNTVTYDLSNAPALASGPNAFVPAFFVGNSAVTFAQFGAAITNVTVPAGSSATITVTVAPNSGLTDDSIFGGYIVITPQGDEAGEVHVPYSGLKGDYQSVAVLTPTTNGYPWLAQLVGTSYVNRPCGATYTQAGTDIPFFVVHLDHQARWMRMEVFDAKTGRSWHRAFQDNYLPRNSRSTSFFALGWDGATFNGNQVNVVPNGKYVVTVTVLKALGDDSNPADTETWTSPVITIARP